MCCYVSPFSSQRSGAVGSGGYFSPSDLQSFYDYGDISRRNLDHISFIGDINRPAQPDLETQLDIQWITAAV